MHHIVTSKPLNNILGELKNMYDISIGVDTEYKWCRSFLSGLAEYPLNGQLTLGELINWYDSWMSIDMFVKGNQTAEYYYHFKILNKTGSISDAYLKNTQNEEKDSKGKGEELPMTKELQEKYLAINTPAIRKTSLRQNLENDSKILISGTNRGRKYRWLTARAPPSDDLVAKLIITILFELQRAESWKGLYEYVKHGMMEFHKSLEQFDKTRQSYFTETGSPSTSNPITFQSIIIERNPDLDLPKVTFTFKRHFIDYHCRKFDSDMSQFCKNTYDYKWFTKSSSNIQKYLNKSGEVVTSTPLNTLKRGEWCHIDYIKLELLNPSKSNNLYKDLEKLFIDIKDFNIKYPQSPPQEMLILMLEEEISKLKSTNKEPNTE